MADAFEGLATAGIDGITLAYREQGDGEPVVFVHGSASDLRTWEQQVPAIGASYRGIAYSRRYARPNEDIGPGIDDQMLPHVDDLISFLRAIDAAPAHLVGNSWGGVHLPCDDRRVVACRAARPRSARARRARP